MKPQLFILTALFMLLPCVLEAQVKPRIAGLSDNTEYIQLLEQERELSHRQDSLNTILTHLREEYRSGRGNTAKILALENELLEIRAQTGMVAGKISAIEQEYIITNPQNSAPDDDVKPIAADIEQIADITANEAFLRLLRADDYAGLRRAQSQERDVAGMAKRYVINYDKIVALGETYSKTDDASAADSIFTTYLNLSKQNVAIADSLSGVWRDIYDNKLFAYNYLLQSENQMRLLERLESANREVRDEIARQRETTVSEEVTGYFAEKGLVLDYERELAGLFGLTAAADSLKRAAGTFALVKRALPEVDIEERYFINYSEISFHNPAKYNNSNPIPEVEVYRRGVIYRIQLGSYTAKQAVALFKGVYPLAYSQEDGKWIYYAGGFAGFSDAKTALEELKKRGFRGAMAVVWNDGEALALDEKPSAMRTYRVEISGTDGLSGNVREAIREAGNDADIAVSDGIFIVGPFSTAFEAEAIADAARKADQSLSVNTIPNNK